MTMQQLSAALADAVMDTLKILPFFFLLIW